jgi:hypothetical protein
MPHIAQMKGGAKTSIKNSIFVNLAFGMPSGMKPFINLFYLLNHNIRRKETI